MTTTITVGKLSLPNTSLSNLQLMKAVQNLKIPYFRGVFMRNNLPKKPRFKECRILNLDSSTGGGTHWTAWYKNGREKFY